MKKELQDLLVQRYKYVLIAMAVFFVGLSLYETKVSISNWKEAETEVTGKKGEASFYKEIKDKNSYPDGKMTLYYDVNNGDKVFSTDDFEEYKEARLEVFPDKPDQQSVFGSYLNESYFLMIVVTIICGFSLFFYDNKTNFNTLLFSSKFKKKEIYQAKLKIVGGTLLLSLVVSKLLKLAGLTLFIPREHLNASFTDLLPSQIVLTTCLVAIFIVSSFAGVILGEWITGVITISVFWYMLSAFLSGLSVTYYTLTNKNFQNLEWFSINNYFELSKKGFPEVIIPTLFFLLISFVLLFWGEKIFKKLSLENNGKYLMDDSLRRPVQIVFLIFVFFVTKGPGLIEAIKIKVTGINPYGQYEPSVVSAMIMTVIILLVAFMISTTVIYRKNPFKFKKNQENE
ncbi:MAG: hypothetical protein RR554_09425 [Vagococcus sp.]|uniref:hypothetical protein n=1 Tax=Vagococcus sp. TaxID=1933889 RepID=UPI002FCC1F18